MQPSTGGPWHLAPFWHLSHNDGTNERIVIADKIMMAHFTDGRRNNICGYDHTRAAIPPSALGATDAKRLLVERDIQNVKILFCELKKSFRTVA